MRAASGAMSFAHVFTRIRATAMRGDPHFPEEEPEAQSDTDSKWLCWDLDPGLYDTRACCLPPTPFLHCVNHLHVGY